MGVEDHIPENARIELVELAADYKFMRTNIIWHMAGEPQPNRVALNKLASPNLEVTVYSDQKISVRQVRRGMKKDMLRLYKALVRRKKAHRFHMFYGLIGTGITLCSGVATLGMLLKGYMWGALGFTSATVSSAAMAASNFYYKIMFNEAGAKTYKVSVPTLERLMDKEVNNLDALKTRAMAAIEKAEINIAQLLDYEGIADLPIYR